jgi:hypothetical protein
MSHFAKANSANTEEAIVAMRPPADAASIIAAHLKFGLLLLLNDQALFSHIFSRRSRAGMQLVARSSWPDCDVADTIRTNQE